MDPLAQYLDLIYRDPALVITALLKYQLQLRYTLIPKTKAGGSATFVDISHGRTYGKT